MKILWASNFSAQSAYAQQSRLFVRQIKDAGHDVIVFELSNAVGRPWKWDDIPVITIGQNPLGNDMILDYVRTHQIDAVITLVDVWQFQPDIWKDVPFYPWCPVDHHPVPPMVSNVLQSARRIIAMSKYGQTELEHAGFKDVLYVPHAVDPAVFYPRTPEVNAETRRMMGIPQDAFLVSFVGVNDSWPNRKGIPELMMAWRLFLNMHPDAILYMHTLPEGNLAMHNMGGVRIPVLMQGLQIPTESVRFVDMHRYKAGIIEPEEIARIMSASDVQILLSRGEGFGVPLIEAPACGTPVITTNFAAGSTLRLAGWHVDYESDWSWQNAVFAKAGVTSAVECLDYAYQMRGDPRLRQIAAINAQEYHLDNVMREYMLPALERIAQDVLERLAA